MRLLKLDDSGSICLIGPLNRDIPEYAILSHTWGADGEEVTYEDMIKGSGKEKLGYTKLKFCVEQALRHGLWYSWVDTCCIDKSSSAELDEAIRSMFRWYSWIGRLCVSAPPRDSATNMPSTNYPRPFAADPGLKSSTPCYVQSHQLHVTFKATNSMLLIAWHHRVIQPPTCRRRIILSHLPPTVVRSHQLHVTSKVINSMLRPKPPTPCLLIAWHHRVIQPPTCRRQIILSHLPPTLVRSYQLHMPLTCPK
jgi:Heterokaryon incompatibility protein (HET)